MAAAEIIPARASRMELTIESEVFIPIATFILETWLDSLCEPDAGAALDKDTDLVLNTTCNHRGNRDHQPTLVLFHRQAPTLHPILLQLKTIAC